MIVEPRFSLGPILWASNVIPIVMTIQNGTGTGMRSGTLLPRWVMMGGRQNFESRIHSCASTVVTADLGFNSAVGWHDQ